jgi:hypothetical protein
MSSSRRLDAMMRTGRAALVAAAGWLLPFAAAHAEPVTVTVLDELSTGQQEETIGVYFAGRLAGTLHISAAHPLDSFTTTIDHTQHLDYTLCGTLLRLGPGGEVVTHRIDNSGTLGDVAGRTLAAITLNNVLFALEDTKSAPVGQVHPGPACAAAVS